MRKKMCKESFEEAGSSDVASVPACTGAMPVSGSVPAPASGDFEAAPKQFDENDPVAGNSKPASAFPKGQLKPSDLLPSSGSDSVVSRQS